MHQGKKINEKNIMSEKCENTQYLTIQKKIEENAPKIRLKINAYFTIFWA